MNSSVLLPDTRYRFAGGTRRRTAIADAYGLALMVLLVAIPGVAVVKLVGLVVGTVLAAVRHRFSRLGLYIGFSVTLSLALGYLVGAANNVPYEDRLNQLVRIASFYMVFACAHGLRAGFSDAIQVDRVCIAIAAVMAGIKIGIWVAVIAFDMSLVELMDLFGFETVTLLIAANIFRLQFPADFVCLFLLAVYCGRRSVWRDLLFIAAVAVVVFLSFSRFFFICFVAGLVIRSIWLKRWDMISTFGALMLVCAVAVFGTELAERFIGEGSVASDETRVEQVQALSGDIELHPFFGRGIGAAVPDFPRSEKLPFSYEMQWYALVMQFGVIGTLMFAANVCAIVFARVRTVRAALCLMALFLLWAFAGFTNPLITSLGSAAGLALAIHRAQLA